MSDILLHNDMLPTEEDFQVIEGEVSSSQNDGPRQDVGH